MQLGKLIRIGGALVALVAVIPNGIMASESVETANIVLYQPDDVLQERGIAPAELATYIQQLTTVVEKQLAKDAAKEALDVVMLVMPGHKSKVWFVSSLQAPPRRTLLARKLEELRPVGVKGGPLAFAISLNISGATRAAAADGGFSPPMPKEWIKAAERAGEGVRIPEGIMDAIWMDPVETLEQQLKHHGFKDPLEVQGLIAKLRKAAQDGDKQFLVAAVHYPMRTYEAGKVVRRYRSATELMKGFDAVFTKRVLNALKTARFEALFVRDQGAMIGSGEVWLGHSRSGVGIHAINP